MGGETKAGVGGRHGVQRVLLLAAILCYWVLQYRVLLGATGCYCVLLGWTDSYFEEEGGLIQMKGLELGKSESHINCNINAVI